MEIVAEATVETMSESLSALADYTPLPERSQDLKRKEI